MSDIDQILVELNELRHELDAMDETDPRRTELEDRRAHLQHRARLLADTARNPDYLRRELDHLEKRLAEIRASQIKPSLVEGHRWINDPSAYARSINRRIADNYDEEAAALTKRAGELRQALGLPPLPAPPPDPRSRNAGKG